MKAVGSVCGGGLLWAALAGCGGDPGPPAPADSGEDGLPDPATAPLAGACPADADHGGFVLELNDASAFRGRVRDGVLPADRPEPVATVGDCALLRPPRPFCDPPCDAGEVCDLDETCVDYPASVGLGLVTVEGLVAPLEVAPLEPGAVYDASALPHPAALPDASIRLGTEGGPLGPLALLGVGPELLTGVPAEVALARGADLSLSWAPPVGLGRGEVGLTLRIDAHGVTPAWIACRFADTGSGTVPATLVDALFSSGVSGFPSLTLARETGDHVAVDGACVDFVVRSPVERTPTVEGHTPCFDDADCPDGQTCDLELESCV